MTPETLSTSPTLLDSLQELSAEQMQERAKEMTALQLDELMSSVEEGSQLPKVFENETVRDELSRRIEEVEVTEETRTRWEALKTTIDTNNDPLEGKSFFRKLISKGGVESIMKGIGLSVLAWFGFKHIGKLKGGVEFAKNHPIITALLSAMGISVGSTAYQYIKGNEGSIVDRIKDEAAVTGKPAEEVARTFGKKLHNMVDNSTTSIAKGVAMIFGGEFNEETGVVTLPGGALLRHPVVTVYKAGKRLDMTEKRGVSRFVLEKRLDAILQQTQIVSAETTTKAAAKKVLAERASKLLKQGVLPQGSSRESLELDRILKSLTLDITFNASDLAEEVKLRPQEVEARLKTLESEMHALSQKEAADFRKTKASVSSIMSEAEGKLRAGADIPGGDVQSYKKMILDKVKAATAVYENDMHTKKIAVANQITEAMNSLSDIDGKGMAHLDAVSKGKTTGILDSTTKRLEVVGMSVRRTTVGRFATNGLIGLSLAPLALEGFAALGPGEKGNAAKEALKNDLIETGGGFIPVVGEIMDFKAAFSGQDLNGRELTATQRATAGAMGVLGSASIVLGFFTGGVTVVGFRALRGAAAARKAVKIAKLANKGEQTMSAAKALKVAKAAEKNADVLKKMSKTTKLQRNAQTARRFVRNGQRTVQVATYAHLGMQLTSGAVDLMQKPGEYLDSARQSIHKGIDTASGFVTSKTP
ncbi:hypothetical protein COU75_02005 [Candidatus Peregrinibacteria bacterium CG10_big_fil_rev_8_21_14_0_10_42_8]|nr:MAG: hypothetical protein COU75_02005 [Candidatus Peregrinibacteria bacterium CG10_big_fil_rev_8_21_14_0_10_42_8]